MEHYKFSQLEFIPTNYEEIQLKLTNLTHRVGNAGTPEEVVSCMEAYESLMENVKYTFKLAYIRSSLDCTDKFYQNALQEESTGSSMLDSSPYFKALLDSPFLPQLEQRFGSQLRPILEQNFRINAAGHELKAKEQILISEYQQKKASLRIPFREKSCTEAELFAFFEHPDRQTRIAAKKALSQTVLEQKEELASMLMELISLRDRIAKANQFENYLDYANTVYSRRGYGEAEMTAFCKQVKEELVPLLLELQEEQRQILGVDKLMSYDSNISFVDGNAVPAGDAAYLTAQSKHMYDALSPEFGQFFRGMVDTESLDVTASPNKVAGMGFCTNLKKNLYPYVFGNCNGTDTDITVFTHEIGHAWETYLAGQRIPLELLREMPLDAVEIPSKTMELFTYPYAESFFGKDADKFRQGHFRAALREIASYCAIHELNTWIYTHVGASFEEILQKEREIAKQYNPNLDHGELEIYNAKGADLLRNMAVYMFPRYVISYALSEMCAMDLFRKMQENPKDAWSSYEKLCSTGGSRSYPDILAQAGLEPSYAEGRVRKVVAFARDYLKF